MSEIYWLNKESRDFLKNGYLLEGETAEERLNEIAKTAEQFLFSSEKFKSSCKDYKEQFLNYLKLGFYSLSSPVWSNFGRSRGLPISCFGSYIEDTVESLLAKASEVGMMSKMGGGTSAYFGEVRPRGSKISTGGNSTGSVHFMKLYETMSNVISQGNTRRGSFASYLPIEHPDIEEFLQIKDEASPIQDISIGVTITDEWMKSIIDGDKKKRNLWGQVIKKKYGSGYPYIVFIDNANNQAPDVYKDKNLKITHSNLCSEIMLPDSPTESFVCCLSSMNLAKWDEWKDTNAVELMIYFLDCVMEEFIQKSENLPFMQSANNFAKKHRALGLGGLGWSTYLQENMIPFESFEAKMINSGIWKTIREKANNASKFLAECFGEPEYLKGYGRRNSTLLAIAPTVSSSFILGQVSPSIEPLKDNYFVKDLAKTRSTYINPTLKKFLKSKEKDTPEVWESILKRGGSVQHLDFLTQHEKDVFKTFGEISQKEIIIQAAQRQKYVDQGQSLNLMIPPTTKPKEVSDLLIFAWEQGIKSIYYQRSANPAQELARNILQCKSCEG
jgi:ribonucleoside-diphosphate reductase alpha chain